MVPMTVSHLSICFVLLPPNPNGEVVSTCIAIVINSASEAVS